MTNSLVLAFCNIRYIVWFCRFGLFLYTFATCNLFKITPICMFYTEMQRSLTQDSENSVKSIQIRFGEYASSLSSRFYAKIGENHHILLVQEKYDRTYHKLQQNSFMVDLIWHVHLRFRKKAVMNRNSGRPKIGYIHDFCVFGLKMVNKQIYYGVNDANMASKGVSHWCISCIYSVKSAINQSHGALW